LLEAIKKRPRGGAVGQAALAEPEAPVGTPIEYAEDTNDGGYLDTSTIGCFTDDPSYTMLTPGVRQKNKLHQLSIGIAAINGGCPQIYPQIVTAE
jgi:hypothetical protein